MTHINPPITITDTYGQPVAGRTRNEPNPGSVVLTDGEWGTGWQLHFGDGLWHPMRGGAAKTWADLCGRRNLVLVYAARERFDSVASRPESEARARRFLGLDLDVHGVQTGRMSAEALGLRPVEDRPEQDILTGKPYEGDRDA